jgi:ribosomal 50S subunit-recycling heat shock protein
MALVAMTSALAQKGESVVSSQKVTATVTKVDQTTREVTIKTEDGQEHSFVAGDAVKNLAQVKPGDVITAVYTEALAYEVKKGGTTGAEASAAAAGAPLGAKPAGVVAHQTTVTVKITAIDPTVPSVTFVGPHGNTETVKVRYPERLKGVSVGDTVELTYTEALAIKVEVAPKP